eukprot:CAMPEP_0168569020 /NCGR_PEP_ID=MMETSP0413-20121227/15903_1 /TAXON_ID=136452 /ORGANISM="Filamoeba nolandi, Strain NC-AS-23-1" /LENGTH=345 /DNA_ID=CAMNT_0008601425 /DNA_START=171 /DNA_END=1208 /DNA_ORIENTATION=+
MAFGLLALYKLGAPSSRLEEFFDVYSKKLEPKIPSQSMINKDNYKEYWGQDKYFEDYYEFFSREIKCMGTDNFIEYYFREAVNGLYGAAFHGIIAVGHGIQIADPEEIAFGMAYLYFSHLPLGTLSSNPPLKLDHLNVDDVLLQIQNEKIFDSLEAEGFQKTLGRILKNPDYMNTVAKYDLDIPEDSDVNSVLWAFIITITKIFAFTGARDFFLLHGVTSCWSLVSTLVHIQDKKTILVSLREYWRALVLTYIVQGRKRYVPLSEEEMDKELQNGFSDWHSLFEKNRNRTNDEHFLKLLFMVKEFEDEYKKDPKDGQPANTSLFKYAAFKMVQEFFDHNSHWIFK